MRIHEFGDKSKPVILLLPGTMCYWKGNFGGVIDDLSRDFLVGCVAYTGLMKEILRAIHLFLMSWTKSRTTKICYLVCSSSICV